MFTFKLPELGEGLSEGELVSWRVKEGDSINADSTLCEIMTDKATVEVPSPKSGTVKKLYYKPGEMAKVHAALVDIEVTGEASTSAQASSAAASKNPTEAAKAAKASTSPSAASASAGASASKGGTSQVLASPAVRKMAREMSLDLSQVQGSGERGRVLRDDLAGASRSSPSSAGAVTLRSTSAPMLRSQALEERIPFIGIRRKISDHLTESAFTAVHFTHVDECDFSEIIRLREEANAFSERSGLGVKLTYLPFFIKASIAAMKRFPILNSSLDTETNEVVIKHYYHYGISVQTDNGLMVGVVRDCDQKDIFQLAREIKEVADRARSGKASMQDLSGSTITITNPGNIGGLFATPIINFPETVILGMYQIKKRPVVKEVNGEDKIVARPMMYVNITCDHRIVDGAIAAGYLRLFSEYIENPGKIAFYA